MKRILESFVIILLSLQPVMAEIVVVTKPLPDIEGNLWPREYFDVNLAMFIMPKSFMIDTGLNKVPVRPSMTRRIDQQRRSSNVQAAWVNIIDLEKSRYYSGQLNKWLPLDSTEIIKIRDGYDTCAVYLRTCNRPGMPPDSCTTTKAVLHDSLKISDIAYVIYTGFNHDRRVKAKIFAKSGYYYRTLLGYIVREIPFKQILDLSNLPDSDFILVGCNYFPNFGQKSIRKVIYISEH